MKKGFTLIEVMMVVVLFTFLFGAVLTILATSDRSWRVGQNKLTEQQEARKAMDNITRLLRQSNPDWIIGTDHYPLTITSDNSRIDFYQPLFDESGEISTLRKITFKLNPDNPRQLLKKEGTALPVVVANGIDNLVFNSVSPVVTINITTQREAEFNLESQVTLRNQNITLSGDVEIEQPAEGEF